MMRAFLLALCLLFPVMAAAAENRTLVVAYIGLEDDPRHAEFRGYANIVLRPAADPFQGAQTALRESAVLARALDVTLELERTQATGAREMIEGIREQYENGVQLFLLDAPGGMLAEVAAATADLDVLLFNVSAPDDELRNAACRPHLFHVFPSYSMLSDALAQYAASRRWNDVLVLHGASAEDSAKVQAFTRSAKRFGLELVDTRKFNQGNDPRKRSRNNIALLTQGDYDLLYVADAGGGIGRFVPYQSRLPRPVIGDHGLVPAAWHWAAERYGAPQLNDRFMKSAGRHMNSYDWAAWTAVRLILDAVRATRSVTFPEIADYLRGDNVTLDTYKGAPGSFREWSNQLRQPILLHTASAVIAYAPLEGFLHPLERLDTLGHDRQDNNCRK